VVGRAVFLSNGCDKEAMNRSMKMTVPPWARTCTSSNGKGTFSRFEAAYMIPQLALRVSGVWLEEVVTNNAFALNDMLHVASENKRKDHVVKCVSPARPNCATVAWDILCDRIVGGSFARSLIVTPMLR
jgi:hypothetical protein